MSSKTIVFRFFTGLKRKIFSNARLVGTWDGSGRYSNIWCEIPMQEEVGQDGCPVFKVSISLDLADKDKTFKWSVILDGSENKNFWGIPTEIQDINSNERHRSFQLNAEDSDQVETYYLTYLRRLGANKFFPEGSTTPKLRFAVWAPNAQRVEVVFSTRSRGYIDNDGNGIDPSKPIIPLSLMSDGIWEGSPEGDYAKFINLPYMYRITNEQGQIVYRTDIFSRSQIGRGDINPALSAWPETVETLDGSVSCSVVTDSDMASINFNPISNEELPDLVPREEFWANEFNLGTPVSTHIEDLVIYEMHVGSLGFGKPGPGDLRDAINFLSHLTELGINAVELLPLAEFSGNAAWGYGDTHHLCIEASAGSRDMYRYFIRECHRRGIAVIQDVVYNHYDQNADRAEWQYDSTDPHHNNFYWYEGHPSDYSKPDGGYINNGSSGFAPRYWEETVRQQFISSAAFLIEEMHVDGLRVDLTQAIHRDNTRNADGCLVESANVFGQKFLRQWSRTLHMIRPKVMLIAEDHTGWDAVTKSPDHGGLGFDASWYVSFYHSLIGDSNMAGDRARLLKKAGFGGNEPLHMDWFAGDLYATQYKQIVYHEAHDELGNAEGTDRTINVAVNNAPLWGATRTTAEARSRLSFALSLLSAGIPMFFQGEEVGGTKRYTYKNFLSNREDILNEKNGTGKNLFRFYKDIISLSRKLNAIRTSNIDILHQNNENRVIAFKRWSFDEEVIIVGSFNNYPYRNGYVIEKDFTGIPNAEWKEIFNSDSEIYGGQNIGNGGATIPSQNGSLNLVIPSNGFVVFVKQ